WNAEGFAALWIHAFLSFGQGASLWLREPRAPARSALFDDRARDDRRRSPACRTETTTHGSSAASASRALHDRGAGVRHGGWRGRLSSRKSDLNQPAAPGAYQFFTSI